LVPLLKDKNAQVRQTAYQILWRAGPDAIPYLAEGLKSTESGIREQAVSSLGNLKVADDKVVQSIVTLAKTDPHVAVRAAAFRALIHQGPKYLSQVEEVFKGEKEPNNLASGLNAIGGLGVEGKPFVPFLIEGLKHPSVSIRINAANALAQLGPNGKEAIPALGKALQDEHLNVQHSALYALRNMTPESGPALVPGLKSKDYNLRSQTLWAFVQYKLHPKEAIPALIGLLKDKDDQYLRQQAAQALVNYGPEAKEAIPALTKALNDPNAAVRTYAKQALEKIQGK
jgi:HEAT repeat protein